MVARVLALAGLSRHRLRGARVRVGVRGLRRGALGALAVLGLLALVLRADDWLAAALTVIARIPPIELPEIIFATGLFGIACTLAGLVLLLKRAAYAWLKSCRVVLEEEDGRH